MAGLSFENRSQPGELPHQSAGHVNCFTEICSLPRYKRGSRWRQAMAGPARIPQWLKTDLVIIVLSIAIIGLTAWIAP